MLQRTSHRRTTFSARSVMISRSPLAPSVKFAIVKSSKSAPYSVRSVRVYAVGTVVRTRVKMFVKPVIYFND